MYSIDSPPRTMMEVFKMLPEGTLVELINNILYMSPPRFANHQIASKNIFRKLLELVEDKDKGLVFYAPLDVYLDEIENAVQPDLIVILRNNLKIIDEKGHIHGVPDMLIEILSKDNEDHDLIRKKQLYERFGVKEYWIIEPDSKLAMGFELKNKQYTLITEDIGLIKSNLLQVSFTF
jgi:Uma2 family endonuclease